MAEFAASIDIQAPPEAVFRHLTTDAGMTAWMGTYAALDPRPGGSFAVDVAGYPIRGTFLHVDPSRRVVFSWGMVGSDDLPPGSSTVEFTLSPIVGGTRVDLRHSDLPEPQQAGHADGWAHFTARLRTAAQTGDAGPDHWRPTTDIHAPTGGNRP